MSGTASSEAGERDRLASTVTHLVGRTRAHLAELASIERELSLMHDPHAVTVLAALAATQDAARSGSLACIWDAGLELLAQLVTVSSEARVRHG